MICRWAKIPRACSSGSDFGSEAVEDVWWTGRTGVSDGAVGGSVYGADARFWSPGVGLAVGAVFPVIAQCSIMVFTG